MQNYAILRKDKNRKMKRENIADNVMFMEKKVKIPIFLNRNNRKFSCLYFSVFKNKIEKLLNFEFWIEN